jgi:hypothetical protein
MRRHNVVHHGQAGPRCQRAQLPGGGVPDAHNLLRGRWSTRELRMSARWAQQGPAGARGGQYVDHSAFPPLTPASTLPTWSDTSGDFFSSAEAGPNRPHTLMSLLQGGGGRIRG